MKGGRYNKRFGTENGFSRLGAGGKGLTSREEFLEAEGPDLGMSVPSSELQVN